MGEIATLVSAGGGGLLVLVIIYLLSGNRADRQQYEDLLGHSCAQRHTVCHGSMVTR